jgi:TonB family protein
MSRAASGTKFAFLGGDPIRRAHFTMARTVFISGNACHLPSSRRFAARPDQWRLRIVAMCLWLGLVMASPAYAQFERAPDQAHDGPASTPAPRSELVMPKLTQFVSADYPTDARTRGLVADVVLRLTIDETGKVSEADVLEPAGHGFDEAARAAALQFIFEPALRDGKPFKVRIKYKYSFTLTAVTAPSASEPQSARLGNLAGVVRIAGAEVPLAGVEIDVSGPGGWRVRRTTDPVGHWQADALEPGRYGVTVAAPGFAPFSSNEDVAAGEATQVTYRLSETTNDLEVTVTGERPPREVTRRTIERREIERIPGTSGDAIRSIENMPGVARPPDLSGMLIVRGSYPDDTQVFVDGSYVPLIYHFGGLRSVVPTELLERIDFYPGNFSAQYGRGMGGVVDVALRAPDTTCKGPYAKPTERTGCFNAIGSVDLLEGRALVQGPLPVKGWTFAAGLRRSWVDAWLGPVLSNAGANVRSLPVYYDWQLIAENKPSRDSRVSLRFFGNDDRFAVVVDPLAQEPAIGGNLQYVQTNWTAQGLYEAQLARNVSTRVMASLSRISFLVDVGSFTYDSVYYPVQYRHEFGCNLMQGVKLNAGLDVQVIPFDITAHIPLPPVPGQADPGPFVNQEPLTVSVSQYALRQAVYADAELQPTRRWRIVPGFRLDYSRDTRSVDANPRVVSRFDLVQGGVTPEGRLQRRTTVKAGAGVYTQPPSFDQTDSVFGTRGIVANRSEHYSFGVEQELTRQIQASVEGFYKHLDRLVAVGADPTGPRYTNLGSGSVVGLETLIKYKPDQRFFGWLAYTLSRSVRRDFPSDHEYQIPYDQTHNLTALGSYRLGRGWEIGARFRLTSGNLVTPVVKSPSLPAIYAADAGAYLWLQGQRYSERLPLNHQLDIRVDKRWQFRDWQLGVYLDVYNVYNHPAAENVSYDYRYVQRSYQTGLPILPSIGVRGEI